MKDKTVVVPDGCIEKEAECSECVPNTAYIVPTIVDSLK